MMDFLEIISRCKKGDQRSQRILYDHFCTQMFLVARRYVKKDYLAEEIMNEGLFKFLEALDKFEYKSYNQTVAYLKKIIVNACIDHFRGQDKIWVVSIFEPGVEDIEICQDILEGLTAKEIFTAITKLPDTYRFVFNLAELENMSHDEIGKKLEITPGASRSLLMRAKKKLQQILIHSDKSYETRKNA